MKKQTKFSGPITYISCSPHGDPEGIVLEDGSFIKVPPHSLLNKDLIVIGAEASGCGELVTETPNPVLHHAVLTIGKITVSDDSVPPHERDELKERHEQDLEKRKDAPSKKLTLNGVVVALGTKPKGEVDRIILADGTSVHVPKHVELSSEDFEIGATVEVEGEARVYGSLRFVKAKSVSIDAN